LNQGVSLKLSDLKPDTKNANRGTIRGRKAVAKSLEQFGAGRSVLIDKDGNLIAGNKTAEQAAAAGIQQDVIVVQTDGSQLVVVQRTDLSIDDPKARELAIADNRASEVGLEWDPGVLDELSTDLDLKPFFTDAELDTATGKSEPEPIDAAAEWAAAGMPEAHNENVQARQIVIHFKSAEDVQQFAELIAQPITDKTKYIWYPQEKPIVARKTKYVESEQDTTAIPAIHSEPVPVG
jgi:hypothetical protein